MNNICIFAESIQKQPSIQTCASACQTVLPSLHPAWLHPYSSTLSLSCFLPIISPPFPLIPPKKYPNPNPSRSFPPPPKICLLFSSWSTSGRSGFGGLSSNKVMAATASEGYSSKPPFPLLSKSLAERLPGITCILHAIPNRK